jgi:uncharacterized protein (UPF0333 family)
VHGGRDNADGDNITIAKMTMMMSMITVEMVYIVVSQVVLMLKDALCDLILKT